MCDIERGEETKATIHYEQSPSERQSDSSNSSSKKLSFFVKGCVFLVIVAIVAALATLPNVVRNLNDGQGMIGNTGSDGLFPSTTASPAPPSASPTSIPSDPRLSRSFYGIDYTPHGAQAQFQCGITQQQVNQDLQVLSQLTSRIRLYGMDCDQASLVLEGIKSLQLDMGVLLTLWVDDNQTTYERQYKTFWNVVDKYGSDHILGVSVGNEAIYRNQIATSDLISLIKDVKTKLQGLGYSHIPVYTTEIKDLKHLIPEEDAVLDNVHPFFAGVHVQDAANWTWQYFYDVDQYPTIKIARKLGLNETQAKPAIISEIGWPTKPKERNVEGAVPSVENMQILLETFICQANERGLPYYWFEFKDQPWKEAAFNETREAYWGLFDKDLKLKPSKMPNCPLVPWKKGDTSVPQPVPIGSRSNDAPEEE